MTYSEATYEYFFKVFYKWTNKNIYEPQILRYNIYHINIIILEKPILITKILDKSTKKTAYF